MKLYDSLVAAKNELVGRYDDIELSQDVASAVLLKNHEYHQARAAAVSSDAQRAAITTEIVQGFTKFFAEPIDPTVPEPFYAYLGRAFIHAKADANSTDINQETRTALSSFLFFGHPTDILNDLHSTKLQNWLYQINTSEVDDFDSWFSNLLVEVSQEFQDQKFNKIGQHIIDVMRYEVNFEEQVTSRGLPLAQFSVSSTPGGSTRLASFTTREINLDGTTIMGSEVDEIQFGTESHTEHAGFFSNENNYTTITVFLANGSQYTRYENMGNTENSINASRISNQKAIEKLASIYEVTNGGHSVSASGFRTSYSIGWWI